MEDNTQTANIRLLDSKSVFRWTFDFEGDWGGRTYTLQGIEEGLPIILNALDSKSIKAIFFLSTEYLERYLPLAKEIMDAGHVIGSHGHRHISWRFRKWWEWRLDRLKSMQKIKEHLKILGEKIPYRAPKFSFVQKDQIYSIPKNHYSVLKGTWLGVDPKPKDTIYLHPFDIVKPKTKAPNLFCSILYSRHSELKERFLRLVREDKTGNGLLPS